MWFVGLVGLLLGCGFGYFDVLRGVIAVCLICVTFVDWVPLVTFGLVFRMWFWFGFYFVSSDLLVFCLSSCVSGFAVDLICCWLRLACVVC